MTSLLVVLALATLAVARLTRLVVDDRIAAGLRTATARGLGTTNPVTYLIHCRWCLSLWISAALVPPVYLLTGASEVLDVTAWAAMPLAILAVAHTAAIILDRGER